MSAIVKSLAKTLAIVSLATVAFVGCTKSPNPHSYQKFSSLDIDDFNSTPRAVRDEGFLGFGGEEIPAWVENPMKAKSARYPYVALGQSNLPDADDRFNRRSAIHEARLELAAQLTTDYLASYEARGNSRGNRKEKERMMNRVNGTIRESHVISTYEVADSNLVYVLVGVDSRLVDDLNGEYADDFPDASYTQQSQSQPPAVAQSDDFFNTAPGE